MRTATQVALSLISTIIMGGALAEESQGLQRENAMELTIHSEAFEHEGRIPRHYTCEGDDASPPLAWTGVPEGAKTLVLIVDDPDAPDPANPRVTWVHWVLYDIPATATGLAEEATPSASAPAVAGMS